MNAHSLRHYFDYGWRSAESSALIGLTRNSFYVVTGIAFKFAGRKQVTGHEDLALNEVVGDTKRYATGFTLVEMLVCICIVSILAAIILPTLSIVRRNAIQTECASNLRLIGQSLLNYATVNRDWVPRDNNYYGDIALRSPFLAVARQNQRRDVRESELHQLKVLRCKAHPFVDFDWLPTTYISNAMPNIRGAQPLGDNFTTLTSRWSAVRRPSNVVFVTESSNRFSPRWYPLEEDTIGMLTLHDVWDEPQLTRRITGTRHGKTSNALLFDGSVDRRSAKQLSFDDFDDGMRGQSGGRVLFHSIVPLPKGMISAAFQRR